jgi:hypothetical protein
MYPQSTELAELRAPKRARGSWQVPGTIVVQNVEGKLASMTCKPNC